MADESPVLANTNPDGTESGAPTVINSGDALKPGKPTLPGLSRGSVVDTTIDKMNNSLAHVCDFKTELQKNNALKQFLKAQAENIRKAIRAVLEALGLSDATGQTSWATTALKAITRELDRFNKKVLKPIMDFEKLVIGYVAQLQKIIAWILSLPAKLVAILKDCITKLTKLIASTFSDLGDSGPADNTTKDLIAAAKETAKTALTTINLTVKTATIAAAVPIAVMAAQKKRTP